VGDGSISHSEYIDYAGGIVLHFPLMKALKKRGTIPLLAFFVLTVNLFFGQQRAPTEGELKIIAQHKERIEDRIVATGMIEIHYKKIKLFADKVEINTETKDVLAEGNVVIQLPDEVVNCEEIRFNLDSSQGQLREVFAMIQPSVFYEAESIERKSEDLYILKNAKITTCTQPVPRWKFSCSKANFKRDAYIEMWNSVFRIKKVPVFYLPYMRYPLDRLRSTGFLMPQLGHSGQKGFSISESFYWAMKRNMDATLDLDYYSKRGLGGGLEYRYLFSEGVGGDIQFFYFRFKDNPEFNDPPNAYIVRFNHNQLLPFRFKLVADVDYQSSFDFLREFDNDFKRAVVANRSSQVYLSRSWSYFNFNVRASRFETYYRQRDDSIIRHYLPQVGFTVSKMKIFSPLYFSLSSSLKRWEYGWESDYEEDKQRKSQSMSLVPTLTVPFSSIPWLTVDSSFSYSLQYYFQSFAAGTKTVVDDPLFTQNYMLGISFTGPVLYKTFFGAEKTPKLKHIVEPVITYRYESPIDMSDRIITERYFIRNHYFRYGLTNRFLVRENNMPREIFSLSLFQTFYLAPEESPLRIYTVNGKVPEFSDIDGNLRFYPSRRYSLDFSAAYNPYHSEFSRLRVGANLGRPTDDYFLRLNWYKGTNPFLENVLLKRHQIGVYAGVKIPRLSLEAQGQVDFNIEEKKLLYSGLSLVYHYQCLDFTTDIRIFYFREKPELQFKISFGLGNIGKTTDFLGGLGF
jgi:LPS-assembly protein